jgi:hypothetical protein
MDFEDVQGLCIDQYANILIYIREFFPRNARTNLGLCTAIPIRLQLIRF